MMGSRCEDPVQLMVDLTDDPKIVTPRRLEILSGAARRRPWSDSEKAQIVAETFAPGAVVTHIARRHDVRAQQIHGWRRDAREGRLVLPADAVMTFAPVVVGAPAPQSKKAGPQRRPAIVPVIEIEAPGLVVRIRDGADRDLVEAMLLVLRGRT